MLKAEAALYDPDGNRVAMADATLMPVFQTVVIDGKKYTLGVKITDNSI